MDRIVILNQLSNIDTSQEKNNENFLLALEKYIQLEVLFELIKEENTMEFNLFPCNFSLFKNAFEFELKTKKKIDFVKYLNDNHSKIENKFGEFKLSYSSKDNIITAKIVKSNLKKKYYKTGNDANEYDFEGENS